ncbi:MAG: cation:proton antiporter [Methanoregulaceae archaeon]|nr:cation:proton antiporter [Methanoregulaceae archaeon]
MQGIVLALFICMLLALVTKRFSLPTIPFYILAGLVLGKSGLDLVGADQISAFLTHLGLIFLLFFMGLEIKPDRIWHNQSAIVSSGLIDLNINALIGFVAAYALGFPLFDAVIIAAAFFISSTAMAVTSLVENRKLLMKESETIVWLMVFEDIVVILILALITPQTEHPGIMLAKTVAVLLLLYALIRFGKEQIIWVLRRDDELPVLLTFSAVLGISALSVYLGIPESFMVIAFGTLLGTIDPVSFEVQSRPFKDVFLVVFFVFFGISVNLFSAGISLTVLIAVSVVAILSKYLSGIVIGNYIHRSSRSGIEIWANTIGRGEFSIVIAALYASDAVSGTIACMVIITSIVGAFVAKYSEKIGEVLIRPKNPDLFIRPGKGQQG